MITRKQKININSDEIQCKVSYGVPDCKMFIRILARLLTHNFDEEAIDKHISTPTLTERDARYTFEHHPAIFGNYPRDFASQLSGWAWATCIRENLVIPSTTDGHKFFFSPAMLSHRGRPKKQ